MITCNLRSTPLLVSIKDLPVGAIGQLREVGHIPHTSTNILVYKHHRDYASIFWIDSHSVESQQTAAHLRENWLLEVQPKGTEIHITSTV